MRKAGAKSEQVESSDDQDDHRAAEVDQGEQPQRQRDRSPYRPYSIARGNGLSVGEFDDQRILHLPDSAPQSYIRQ